MIYIDDLMDMKNTQAEIDGKWVIAKPISYWDWGRFKEAWDVFKGKAWAVYFHEQMKTGER